MRCEPLQAPVLASQIIVSSIEPAHCCMLCGRTCLAAVLHPRGGGAPHQCDTPSARRLRGPLCPQLRWLRCRRLAGCPAIAFPFETKFVQLPLDLCAVRLRGGYIHFYVFVISLVQEFEDESILERIMELEGAFPSFIKYPVKKASAYTFDLDHAPICCAWCSIY